MSIGIRDKDDLAKEYIECYKKGISLLELNGKTETFNVLRLKQGLPVKFIETKDIFNLPMDSQLIGYDGFYKRQKGFYLIPNEFKDKIISFVIRGLTHEYFDVPLMSNSRPMFGWYMFQNFKKNYPIILTEGVKDCIILQQYYPYVLAMLTAGVTISDINILSAMTNKIILAFDRDITGDKEDKRSKQAFEKRNIQVQVIQPHKKDFGMDYNNSNYINGLVQEKLQLFRKSKNIMCCMEE